MGRPPLGPGKYPQEGADDAASGGRPGRWRGGVRTGLQPSPGDERRKINEARPLTSGQGREF